jgi:hypothetical protein
MAESQISGGRRPPRRLLVEINPKVIQIVAAEVKTKLRRRPAITAIVQNRGSGGQSGQAAFQQIGVGQGGGGRLHEAAFRGCHGLRVAELFPAVKAANSLA